jgi:hypothetical protein
MNDLFKHKENLNKWTMAATGMQKLRFKRIAEMELGLGC